jgi:hypothetical protein
MIKKTKCRNCFSLITPWFKEEAGVIQTLAGEKTLIIPLTEYKKIQNTLKKLTDE